jgi:flotillin
MPHLPLLALALPAAAILLGVSLLIAVSLRRVVPTNRVDIVQSSRSTTSYGKGRNTGNVYYAWPAVLPFIGVTVTHFPESVFDITLNGYDAYDSGRLPFLVDIMAFFRIDDSDTAAHRVADFPELQAQLKGVLQGAVRRTLAVHPLEKIMEDRTALGDTFTKEVNDQLKEWGVTTAKSIEFMDIRDTQSSQVIANIMAKEKSRIENESRQAVAANHQAAELREIEAQQVVAVREQEKNQLTGQRQAQAEQEVGISQQQARQAVLQEGAITAQKEMEVKQVQSVRQAEIERAVAEVAADQKRKVTVVEADAQRQTMALVAEGQLTAAQKNAEATRVEGEAKGAAETAINLAAVAPQITLAKEIGSNVGYQEYLVRVERIKADQTVGVAQAAALTAADVKVIVTGGNASDGMKGISALISPQMGAVIGGLVEGVDAVAPGVVERIAGRKARANGAVPS